MGFNVSVSSSWALQWHTPIIHCYKLLYVTTQCHSWLLMLRSMLLILSRAGVCAVGRGVKRFAVTKKSDAVDDGRRERMIVHHSTAVTDDIASSRTSDRRIDINVELNRYDDINGATWSQGTLGPGERAGGWSWTRRLHASRQLHPPCETVEKWTEIVYCNVTKL